MNIVKTKEINSQKNCFQEIWAFSKTKLTSFHRGPAITPFLESKFIPKPKQLVAHISQFGTVGAVWVMVWVVVVVWVVVAVWVGVSASPRLFLRLFGRSATRDGVLHWAGKIRQCEHYSLLRYTSGKGPRVWHRLLFITLQSPRKQLWGIRETEAGEKWAYGFGRCRNRVKYQFYSYSYA